MIETRVVVFCGLTFVFAKFKRRTMLRLLNHDLLLDVGVSLIMLAILWGNYSGKMAATVAGLLTSLATSMAKKAFGHIQGVSYFRGYIRLAASVSCNEVGGDVDSIGGGLGPSLNSAGGGATVLGPFF